MSLMENKINKLTSELLQIGELREKCNGLAIAMEKKAS
jgi:hypothetical protein